MIHGNNVVLEYLASGIPAVVTDTGGNREIILDGKNGFFFPVNDHKALAELLELILDDHALYSRLCKNAKNSVEGRFSNSNMVRSHETFFRTIFKGKA